MSFVLGNHSVDEVLYGVAQSFDGDILYSLDQLMNATVEVSAESTDITDKKGNVVRTIYTSKTGTLNATNAFLHPAVLNASSGSEVETASASNAIKMPKIVVVNAGKTLDVTDAVEGTIAVVGLYQNGANKKFTLQASASMVANNTFTAPAAAAGEPIQYLVRYERNVTDGIKLVNDAYAFPTAVQLTLYCSYVDPCDDELKPMYLVAPNFMADPNMSISLDRETQEVDFNGNLNVDFCGTDRVLYYIYYPGNNEVVTAISE